MLIYVKKIAHVFCVCFLIVFTAFLDASSIAYANEMPASVSIEIAPNAISDFDTDIAFTPERDKVYEFTIRLTNQGDQEVELEVYPSVAVSTGYGLFYGEDATSYSDDRYDIRHYLTLLVNGKPFKDRIIVLSANEAMDFTVQIKVPDDETLMGEIIGGFNVQQTLQQSKEGQAGMAIIPITSQVKIIRLNLDDHKAKKALEYQELSLQRLNLDTLTLNYSLVNPEPYVRNQDVGTYQIVNDNGHVLIEGDLRGKDGMIAPMSQTPISMEVTTDEQFTEGTYTLVLQREKQGTTKVNFTITKEQAETLNNE